MSPGTHITAAFVPVSYYIDRNGVIRAVSYGPPPSGFLDDQIRRSCRPQGHPPNTQFAHSKAADLAKS